MSKCTPCAGQFLNKTFSIASAVLTGTVDFSTMILSLVDHAAIFLAADSQYVKSAAFPLPKPVFFVGVFTETKMHCAARIAASQSVEKNKFLPLHAFTTSSSPGS